MKKKFYHLIALAFVAAVAAGCASAPSRFYTLTSTAAGEGSPTNSYAVVIEPVSIPAEVDRPQFTVQTAPNRVAVDEFNRWAASLNEMIASVIAGDLAAQLGTPRVAAEQLANFTPDFRVAISIQQFEMVPSKSVTVEALWVIRKHSGGDTFSGHTIATETVSDDSYDSLAVADSRALAKVSSDIAAVIRAQADAKP